MPSTLMPDRLHADVRELTDSLRAKAPLSVNDPISGRGVPQRLTGLCKLARDEHAAAVSTVLASYAYRCRRHIGHLTRVAEPIDDFVSAVVVDRLRRRTWLKW
jgi:hypothetical protein